MKTIAIVAVLGTLASLATANPVEKRFDVSITFYGVNNEDSYTKSFPTDRTNVQIDNDLVVHRITSPGGGFCSLVGVDGETVVIYAEDDKSLKEPQAMKFGSCGNN
ncbi:hypothetical protein FE257_007331 [Aspergillus nanangensis]|uniref:Uncharacterized protein n=1 Tax=Aspergillus nanangensis TaxID=2582783 RepID=A0AAD4CMT7_ASPNN|nr:hypothetical protein FE257_007331 [Aspergillus nanangensis]